MISLSSKFVLFLVSAILTATNVFLITVSFQNSFAHEECIPLFAKFLSSPIHTRLRDIITILQDRRNSVGAVRSRVIVLRIRGS